mmetsp:Transcript_28134/g.65760  ORF Transcript_28134/g.65760 Transcript_28134/m.65760 type:complete len:203 (+) Transcript_28134:75-683(+)|eukprot:CAMPEP_0171150284 /NCGR_PEP_ID=MMETSP0766_2-20121228/149491_1 /TAXON_ID=439317 /ORGANISM="Gambierdiscus australes, Strain CAWD 149" /LENGTH=202 /DNA_ID=CAMNT_0011614197 /DNA_START=79 /DNA_END=687 /DNA_ORIENTATION=-
MGAKQSTSCCHASIIADDKRVEEWRFCMNPDECLVNEPKEAWAPMPVAALKVLDRERIDPWTREVIEDRAYKGIVDAVMGPSPTTAPSGYLAESIGKDVIVSDGKEGHMLTTTEGYREKRSIKGFSNCLGPGTRSNMGKDVPLYGQQFAGKCLSPRTQGSSPTQVEITPDPWALLNDEVEDLRISRAVKSAQVSTLTSESPS